MKKLLAILFLLIVAVPINDAMAQTNRKRTTTRKTTTNRKTTPKSKSPNKSSQSNQQSETEKTQPMLSKPVPHVFEGSLLYRKYEYNSAVVRKFSQGRAYNGERTILVTLKGNSIHIIDYDMHIHTIILGDQNIAYQYSDITMEGISGKEDFINSFLLVLDPTTSREELPKSFTIHNQNQSISYKEQDCYIFRGELISGSGGTPATTDVEMWGSKLFMSPNAYKYVFDGLPTGNGIIIKGIHSQRGMVPLLGKIVTTVAAELMAYKEYSVSPNEFLVPNGVRMDYYFKPSQLTKFYKNNTKALKKQGIYPQTVDKKEAKYNISSQWDFADEWINKKAKIDYLSLTWDIVGSAMKDIVEIIHEGNTEMEMEENPYEMDNSSSTKTKKKKSASSKRSRNKQSKKNNGISVSSTSTADNSVDCPVCGGDGKCTDCQRKGNGKCSSCGGTGHLFNKINGKYPGCPNCQHPGNGICKSCDGNGKCQNCHGEGKV